MNTKLVMTLSTIVLGIAGLLLSFIPDEIVKYIGETTSNIYPLMLQILGALYFAFAMSNWTARENLVGGIYGRPIAIGNLTHFVIGALALIKGAAVHYTMIVLWITAAVYTIFALLFAVIFFTHPKTTEK